MLLEPRYFFFFFFFARLSFAHYETGKLYTTHAIISNQTIHNGSTAQVIKFKLLPQSIKRSKPIHVNHTWWVISLVSMNSLILLITILWWYTHIFFSSLLVCSVSIEVSSTLTVSYNFRKLLLPIWFFLFVVEVYDDFETKSETTEKNVHLKWRGFFWLI